ncbi:MAG: putative metal-binding motif-containing protein [Polyangiaceae bacterium]|nr:putative metal-binding motif-containing protein [Polyangiaceae bacterium]
MKTAVFCAAIALGTSIGCSDGGSGDPNGSGAGGTAGAGGGVGGAAASGGGGGAGASDGGGAAGASDGGGAAGGSSGAGGSACTGACAAPPGWRDMAPSSSAGIPGRKNAFAVWTGSVMLIWGGNTSDLAPGSYDPATNLWKKLAAGPVTGLPVWTGSELVVVSPNPATPVARFELAKNTWTTLPGTLPIPKRDTFAFAAYLPATQEVMVWGGRKTSCPCDLSDGAAYSLTKQAWRVVATGPLEPRDDTRAPGVVWNGSSLVVFGGGNHSGGRYHTGAAYDPVADTWSAIPESPQAGYANMLSFPLGPGGTLAAFWSGERFGGTNYNYPANDGAVWDAANKKWSLLPGVPKGGAYNGHLHGMAFAASSAFGLYGGTHYANGFSLDATGAVFDVATSTFTELPPGGPSPRKWGVAVWTGTEAIVWGGEGAGVLDDGKIWRACGASAATSAACTPQCGVGTFACGQGALACTSKPGPEQCNGHDDDCNGKVDDAIPSGGACSVAGAQGVCAAGQLKCASGAVSCVPGATASAEVCNGLDDDCDGQADEDLDGQPCTTGKNGACSFGTEKCVNGVSSCPQVVQPNTEVCNGIDDDCDGSVDEGC